MAKAKIGTVREFEHVLEPLPVDDLDVLQVPQQILDALPRDVFAHWSTRRVRMNQVDDAQADEPLLRRPHFLLTPAKQAQSDLRA